MMTTVSQIESARVLMVSFLGPVRFCSSAKASEPSGQPPPMFESTIPHLLIRVETPRAKWVGWNAPVEAPPDELSHFVRNEAIMNTTARWSDSSWGITERARVRD
jgi:hypothetical protein